MFFVEALITYVRIPLLSGLHQLYNNGQFVHFTDNVETQLEMLGEW